MAPESAVLSTDDEIVAAWCAQGGARLDPVRLHHIAALRRRAAAAQGALRQALEQRLAAQVAACADELARGALAAPRVARAGPGDAPSGPHPLVSLVEALERQAADRTRAVHGEQVTAFPELPALEPARRQWAAVRNRSRLQSALAPPPVDAGPLNSTHLVHRAFALMRALSPGYLQHFLEHLDTVSGLERLTGAGAASDGDAARAPEGRKRGRAAPRRRRS